MLAVITIGIDPNIHIGPITLAWHGVTIAIGVAIGALLAGRLARARELDSDPLYTIVGLLGVAIGRIGDVINGEHYGPQSDFCLAVRNSHPDALTPNPHLADQNG